MRLIFSLIGNTCKLIWALLKLTCLITGGCASGLFWLTSKETRQRFNDAMKEEPPSAIDNILADYSKKDK